MSVREDTDTEGSNCQQSTGAGEYFLVFKGANCCVGSHSILFVEVRSLIQLLNSPHRTAVLLQRVDTEHCLENTFLERFSFKTLSNPLKLELSLERSHYTLRFLQVSVITNCSSLLFDLLK